MLADFPEAGRLRPDLGPGVRCFPVEKQMIYYSQNGALVVIARVLHGSRDQAAALKEPTERG